MMLNEAAGELNELMSAPLVKYAGSEDDIREVARLDESIYGGQSIDYEGLLGWWRTYEKGVYVLWKDARIVGAIGIWPIKKATYGKLVRGKLDETDLTANDISGRPAGGTYSYWYFADIVLQKEFQDRPERHALTLLDESLGTWLSEGRLSQRIHVCALGFEDEGVSLLEKFKFLPPGKGPVRSPKNKPVYARSLTVDELRRELNYLKSLRHRSPRPGDSEYDFFISYRREYLQTAALIQEGLEKKRQRVFWDLEGLRRQGLFDEALRASIARTPNFIVILSPGCFADCCKEDDWFTHEIALAIEKKRTIIPVKLEGFEFPDAKALPASIQDVIRYQAIEYSDYYFKPMIKEIIEFTKAPQSR